MQEHAGPIYEVTLTIDAIAAEGLDEWLAVHVGAMLEQPGFDAAEISRLDDSDGTVGRVVRYYIASNTDLDNYLAGPVDAMRRQTADRFGEHVTASRRVLEDSVQPAVPDSRRLECLNCGAVLAGQYCGQCGQRAQSRLISVWELLKDAFGDLLDVDSRLWRTLIQLAIRPGALTRDYLLGRRARYMPPFRTYLVLSLLFFAIAFFDPRESLGILFEPTTEAVDDAAGQEAVRQEVLKELEAEGILVGPPDDAGADQELRFNINGEEVQTNCELEDYDPADLPGWLGRRLTHDRVKAVCQRMTAKDGEGVRGFLDRMLESVPAGLFVLLPLMALVLKVLYPLSKRYYVEHLLLILHFHAFVFLALITQVGISRLGEWAHVPDFLRGIAILSIAVYVNIYLYKMLRRVYGQGHWLTALKFVLLLAAYWIGLLLLLLAMALLAAFST